MNWISVKDKKPEVGIRVVGAMPFDEDSWYMMVGNIVKIYNDEIAIVKNGHHWQMISHWMILEIPEVIDNE